MTKIILTLTGIFSGVASAQAQNLTKVFKTYFYNSQQWSAIKLENNNLLNGIVVNSGQKLQLDLDKNGQIINLKIFDEPSMIEIKVDGSGA